MPSAVFRIKHKQGYALTILKNFQRNALIKTCSLVHCSLNSQSLIHVRESVHNYE